MVSLQKLITRCFFTAVKGSENMFSITGREITLSRGDTGAIKFKANVTRRDTGAAYTFGVRDRAVFSIKSGAGQVVKQKAYPMINNEYMVIFMNADTDKIAPGGYSWDTRYVINPYYEDDPPAGTWTPYADLTFPVAKDTKCMYEGTYFIANQAIQSSEDFNIAHWTFADYRIPVDGDQVVTPYQPTSMNLLTVVGDI